MAQAMAKTDIRAPADEVWRLIGGFGSLPDWTSSIRKSELQEGGRIRHLTTMDGVTVTERLMAFDEGRRSYSYTIVSAPFPVTDYLSTISVTEASDGEASHVEWSGRFTPEGVDDQGASLLFQGIYEDGMKALAAAFAAKKK